MGLHAFLDLEYGPDGDDVLLAVGAALDYPTQPDSDAYFSRLLGDASPAVKSILEHAR